MKVCVIRNSTPRELAEPEKFSFRLACKISGNYAFLPHWCHNSGLLLCRSPKLGPRFRNLPLSGVKEPMLQELFRGGSGRGEGFSYAFSGFPKECLYDKEEELESETDFKSGGGKFKLKLDELCYQLKYIVYSWLTLQVSTPFDLKSRVGLRKLHCQ